MKKLALLGGLTPAQFLKEYWQKKPLLIRQAISGFEAPLTVDQLFMLASGQDVESRLISHARRKWQMQRGPFHSLPSRKTKAWTLLVQGANLLDGGVDALLNQFRFLPDARLDDLMISYATDAGGVGPHFDSYDVFLLQAHGRRHWRIGAQKDLSLVEGLPLKILKNFRPTEEFVLDPGDMLYLPPHYAHDGVAVDECMTYSIGFRAPAYQELGEAFLHFMADTISLPGRYGDPDLQYSKDPAMIGEVMIDRVAAEMSKIRFAREDISIFLGEYLSEPKPQVFFTPPADPLGRSRFMKAASTRGVALSPATRMLYRGKHVFINGESFIAGPGERKTLRALANSRALGAGSFADASGDTWDALHVWYEDGWLHLK